MDTHASDSDNSASASLQSERHSTADRPDSEQSPSIVDSQQQQRQQKRHHGLDSSTQVLSYIQQISSDTSILITPASFDDRECSSFWLLLIDNILIHSWAYLVCKLWAHALRHCWQILKNCCHKLLSIWRRKKFGLLLLLSLSQWWLGHYKSNFSTTEIASELWHADRRWARSCWSQVRPCSSAIMARTWRTGVLSLRISNLHHLQVCTGEQVWEHCFTCMPQNFAEGESPLNLINYCDKLDSCLWEKGMAIGWKILMTDGCPWWHSLWKIRCRIFEGKTHVQWHYRG